MSMTFRFGLAGLEVCVGGGARPPEDEEEARGLRFGRGPRARWAELAAGNIGRRLGGDAPGGGIRPGAVSVGFDGVGREGGGIIDLCEEVVEGGGGGFLSPSASREKVGIG